MFILSGISWLSGSGDSFYVVLLSPLLAPVGTFLFLPYLAFAFTMALIFARYIFFPRLRTNIYKNIYSALGGVVTGLCFPIYLTVFSDPAVLMTAGELTKNNLSIIVISCFTGGFMGYVNARLWLATAV